MQPAPSSTLAPPKALARASAAWSGKTKSDATQASGKISQAYATGAVSSKATSIGGLVGYSDGAINNSYWNTETTGQATSVGGGTGLTTAELIAGLPGDFATAAWGNDNNQTTPYLLGMSGNQVFNINDLPIGTVTGTNRPKLYTAILDVNQLQAVECQPHQPLRAGQ